MARARKLSKREVDAAPEGWTRDTEIAGFYLRVRGGRRTYAVKYGTGKRGKSRWVTIGEHGAPWRPDPVTGEERRLTAELARREAIRLRGLVADDQDPAAARDRTQAIPTLADFAVRYLRDHAVAHKSEATAEADARRLRLIIMPALGGLRLDRLDAGAIAQLHAARASTPFLANRCLAILSNMVTMAVTWGVLPKGWPNPCADVQRYPEAKRTRFLTAEELGRVGAALESGIIPDLQATAIRLLLLTGARVSEVAGLRWDQVHLAQGLALAPRKGSGKEAKAIIVPPPAVALLRRLARVKGNPHVLPGRAGHLTSSGISQAWQVVRAAAGVEDVRVHDLRHTWASWAVQGGGSLPNIGGVLGHASAATTARYAHLARGPVQAVAADAAKAIAGALAKGRRRK